MRFQQVNILYINLSIFIIKEEKEIVLEKEDIWEALIYLEDDHKEEVETFHED